MPRPKVFVSAASDDYRVLRVKLADRLRSAGIDVPHQESLLENGFPTLTKLDDNLRDSWAVIHIVGPSFGGEAGSKVVDDLLERLHEARLLNKRSVAPLRNAVLDRATKYRHSYTQWEAFLARHYDIPLLVYKPADDSAFDDRQNAHLKRLRDVAIHAKPFTDEANLWELVLKDLVGIRPPRAPNHWEERYLEDLIRQCDDLNLELIARTDQDKRTEKQESGRVTISDVFTTLYLRAEDPNVRRTVAKGIYGTEDIDDDSLRIKAVQAAAVLPRLVILSQPGGGKSTLVNHLSVQLAKKRLIGSFDAGKMPGWDPDRNRLPVRVTLRHFTAWLAPTAPAGRGELVALVWDYLAKQLKDLGFEEYYPTLKQELIEDNAVIFFDGLDEVSPHDHGKRETIIAVISAFSEHLSHCKSSIVVTCREYAYQKGSAWRLDDQVFPVAMLPLFELDQIESFIVTWYDLFTPHTGEQEETNGRGAKNLIRTIREWPHLQELAQHPLLLTLMAIVHGRIGKLPENRAELYDRAVDLLLEHWNNRTIVTKQVPTKRRGLVAWLDIPTDKLLSILAEVAFAAHERQEKQTARSEDAADISWGELHRKMGIQLDDFNKANTAIEYLQNSAGLLQARDNDTYAFPHRTFQEYLAAVHICRKAACVEELRQRVLRNLPWWREVFLLAAGVSGRATPGNIASLADSILPDFDINPRNLDMVLLASQAMWENNFQAAATRQSPPGPYARVLRATQQWLLNALEAAEKLRPSERAAAGVSLARLGDPREEVMSLERMEFSYVPAGKCYADETAVTVDVEAYWISRYPITRAQFDVFVRARGYAEPNYWREAPAWTDAKYDGREDPEEYGPPFGHPNHPVVGVSWFEALAFTRWLTERWREAGILSSDHDVRLPAETEWVKAARGGSEIPEMPHLWFAKQNGTAKRVDMNASCSLKKNPFPQRMYPWDGPDADPNRMNCKESGIMVTSAVGCFPGGISPYGCHDMTGNVRQWCFDKWAGGYDGDASFTNRVVRGGGYGHQGNLCPLSRRTDNTPHFRANDLGFRIVIVAKSGPDLSSEYLDDPILFLALRRLGIRVVRESVTRPAESSRPQH